MVDKELDDAGCVLLDHDLTPESGLLVFGVDNATDLLDRIGNLEKKFFGRLTTSHMTCLHSIGIKSYFNEFLSLINMCQGKLLKRAIKGMFCYFRAYNIETPKQIASITVSQNWHQKIYPKLKKQPLKKH